MAQPVVHFEVIGNDPARLRNYFAQLFGWRFTVPSPVAEEVSAFADEEMQTPPLRLGKVPVEEKLKKVLQGAGGAVGSKGRCRFAGDDQNADQYGNPGAGLMGKAGSGAGSQFGFKSWTTCHEGYST